MRSKKRWMKMILVCVMMLSLMIPQNVFAIDKIDSDSLVSLKLEYSGADGAKFDLYRVADVSGHGEFELTEEFKKYPVKIDDLNVEQWKKVAAQLASYIMDDPEAPESIDSGVVKGGVLEFPTSQTAMSVGLYLVIGEEYLCDHQIYKPEPTLICLPNLNMDEEWVYHETIRPKYEIEKETTEVLVIKQWIDNGNENAYKVPIEVQLVKDGKVYETIILSEENNWQYKWTNLELGDWEVKEVTKLKDYDVSVKQNQTIHIITNTYIGEETPTPPGKLPQTGMLWWPVPVLAGAGILFFVTGWVKRQKDGE